MRVSATENPKVEYAAEQVIRLSREGHYLGQIKTDDYGRFLFDALIPGIYKVEFLGSQDFNGYEEVTITSAGCARLGLWKTYNSAGNEKY
jgi:hypothetical protein